MRWYRWVSKLIQAEPPGPTQQKKYDLLDSVVVGLVLIVLPSGRKSYVVRTTAFDGRRTNITLGNANTWSFKPTGHIRGDCLSPAKRDRISRAQ